MYVPLPCLNPTLSPIPTRRRRAKVGLTGGRHLRHSLAERMVARTIVGPSCWEFQGCRVGPNGYGQIALGDGKQAYAHRVAWQLATGREIPAGLKVLHSCDNPRCVNPAHLSVGTQAENVRESIRKGRYNTWGVQKLNAAQVLAIRDRGASGEGQRSLASAFGVARNTISQILNHKSWAHLSASTELQVDEPRQLVEAPREFRQAAQSIGFHAPQCGSAQPASSTPLKGQTSW